MPGRMEFRTEFVGSHFTPSVKRAMTKQAIKENLSNSEWVFRLVLAKMKELGYEVSDTD